MWNLFKVLPLGILVPIMIGAASVGPEDASSNLSKWITLLGLHDIPAWLLAKSADHEIILGTVLCAIVYVFMVWGRPLLHKRGVRSPAPPAVEAPLTGSATPPAPSAPAMVEGRTRARLTAKDSSSCNAGR